MKRAYYLCAGCHRGRTPLDEKLGLRPNALSAELARLVAMTGVQLPFEMAAELFEELCGVRVSDQMVGKAVRQVGERVEQQEVEWRRRSEDEEQLLQAARENLALHAYTGRPSAVCPGLR